MRFFAGRATELLQSSGAKPGDALVLAFAHSGDEAQHAAGELRRDLVRMIGDKDPSTFACAFITELPFFTYQPEGKIWTARRHPFTQPRDEDLPLMTEVGRKHEVRAKAFTLVINGVELGAGGIRNHDLAAQDRVFALLGIKPAEVQRRFGHVLENFRYGVPPHGGATLQLDRLLALALGVEGIDEVMAFPKSRSGEDLLFETPAALDAQHLRGLLDQGPRLQRERPRAMLAK